MNPTLLLLLSTATAQVPDAATLARAPYNDAVFVAELEERALDECSGMAPSRLHHGILWCMNDDEDDEPIFAIGTDGSARGSFIVDGDFEDPEALSTFVWDGVSYLMVADAGLGDGKRDDRRLVFLPEPTTTDWPDEVTPEKVVRFSFQRQEEDSEAVTAHVDAERGRLVVLVLTKRVYGDEVTRKLYSLDLAFAEPEPPSPELALLCEIEFPTYPRPEWTDRSNNAHEWDRYRYPASPTDMDVSPDGRSIVVTTYRAAYFAQRNEGESWAKRLERPLQLLPLPILRMPEAICFGANGVAVIYVTSERLPTPLFRFDRRD